MSQLDPHKNQLLHSGNTLVDRHPTDASHKMFERNAFFIVDLWAKKENLNTHKTESKRKKTFQPEARVDTLRYNRPTSLTEEELHYDTITGF